MDLIERGSFLDSLNKHFDRISSEEGHCIFVTGESGMGKTSLVKTFCKAHEADCRIYRGACDALFTPRPLAPLYDIMWQVNSELWPAHHGPDDRAELFASFFRELKKEKERILIVFEDIHWADEATLDFIKFFARRITQLRCLFVLTYRDDEIHSTHPLRNVMGQLPPDSFTRLHLTPLSKEAVKKMAAARGYNGEEVYSISGGNPFYVTEILASYSKGVPDNIKDSILTTFHNQEGKTRQIWELLSVIPATIEVKYLEMVEPAYAAALDRCMEAKIIFIKEGHVFFKHELFRRTVEESLSNEKRVSLNRRILDLFRTNFEQNQEIERIIHHAKNANDYETVVHYAPQAARQASGLGSHMEASRLYLTALEYYPGKNPDVLVQLYESYAYECYLTHQIKEAMAYAEKALQLWTNKNDVEKRGNSLRFLSRLSWLNGNRPDAEAFAIQAIEVLDSQPASRVRAMAYSNMSHLKMLSDQADDCITWGNRAIALAMDLNDQETLAHALNNVGAVQMNIPSLYEEGTRHLQQSLEIALKNSYHEHAARAYANLGSNGVKMKNYDFAKRVLNEGIHYCEERDLDSSRRNMLSLRATLYMETGDWKKALSIALNLLEDEIQPVVYNIDAHLVVATIRMRTGDHDVLSLLQEAEKRAFIKHELQLMVPALIAMLEYEWITGKRIVTDKNLEATINRIHQSIYQNDNSEFFFWLRKARGTAYLPVDIQEGFDTATLSGAQQASAYWEMKGCPYAQAMTLFDGDDDDKRRAASQVHALGGHAVYERMKVEMKAAGIKSIPRGIRKATQLNPALLTNRELEVLQLLSEGMQNKEIADKLFISSKTVDHHISAILSKLECKTRIKAVQEAIRMGILK